MHCVQGFAVEIQYIVPPEFPGYKCKETQCIVSLRRKILKKTLFWFFHVLLQHFANNLCPAHLEIFPREIGYWREGFEAGVS